MTEVNTGGDGRPTPVANKTGYHVYHDPRSGWSLSETLIAAIASIRNIDPTKTTIPLTDRVDVDALDAIFAETYDGRSRDEGYVAFSVSDIDVYVHANGHVFIRE